MSLSTAAHAMEQNREFFPVPGPVDSLMATLSVLKLKLFGPPRRGTSSCGLDPCSVGPGLDMGSPGAPTS